MSYKRASLPEPTGCVPKLTDLSYLVAVTSGDTEEEGVELGELVSSDDRVLRLGRRMHLVQDIFGQSLGDSSDISARGVRRLGSNDGYLLEDLGSSAGGLDAFELRFGQLLHVTVHGVLISLAIYCGDGGCSSDARR